MEEKKLMKNRGESCTGPTRPDIQEKPFTTRINFVLKNYMCFNDSES